MTIIKLLLLTGCLFVLPFLTVGLMRKTKARMQGRVGASVQQPLREMLKMLQKGQTISNITTWIFQFNTAIGLGTMLFIAMIVPWVSFKPTLPGDDLFYLLYLLVAIRFFNILAAMDTGSAFGGFGASREAYLSMLTEPAMFISLASLGIIGHSSKLSVIFDYGHPTTIFDLPVWLGAAVGLFLCSLVHLSRMPIDDPTTHLELTMVHEAMLLENSGKNLGLVEFTHLLKMVVLYGLSVQCLLHVLVYFTQYNSAWYAAASIFGILLLGIATGVIESLTVKMQWRRTPEFIAYALTISLFATAAALIGGAVIRHGL